MTEDTQGTTPPLQDDNGTLYTTTALSPPRTPSSTTSPPNDGPSIATHGTAIAAGLTDDGNTTSSLGALPPFPSANKAKDTNAIILQPPSQDFLPFGINNTPAGTTYYALLSVLSQDFIYGVNMVNESRKLFCSDEYPLSFTGVEALVGQQPSNLGSLSPAHSLILLPFISSCRLGDFYGSIAYYPVLGIRWLQRQVLSQSWSNVDGTGSSLVWALTLLWKVSQEECILRFGQWILHTEGIDFGTGARRIGSRYLSSAVSVLFSSLSAKRRRWLYYVLFSMLPQ